MHRERHTHISAKCAFQSIPTERSTFMAPITLMTIRVGKYSNGRHISSRSPTRPIKQWNKDSKTHALSYRERAVPERRRHRKSSWDTSLPSLISVVSKKSRGDHGWLMIDDLQMSWSLGWKTCCFNPIVFWKPSATPRQTETITRVDSANTWTSTLTSKVILSAVTSATICLKRFAFLQTLVSLMWLMVSF